jgi:hypothetical protein
MVLRQALRPSAEIPVTVLIYRICWYFVVAVDSLLFSTFSTRSSSFAFCWLPFFALLTITYGTTKREFRPLFALHADHVKDIGSEALCLSDERLAATDKRRKPDRDISRVLPIPV